MSSTQLDVYRDWLGIKETARPLNHYQLLGLKLFEDDPSAVRAGYRKLNAHVRKYAAGEYGPQSQALLNELCQAMLCLTDGVRKAEYDASLGRSAAPTAGKARTFEELLVARKVVTAEQLEKARRLSKTIGVEVRDAVMQQRSAPAEQVMPVYAESIGLPFIELADVEIDESLLPKVPAVTARQQSCAPLMVADGRVLMMTPHLLPPEIEDLLRLRFGMPVRLVMATPGDVNQVISKHYSREAAGAELASGVRPADATPVAAVPSAAAPSAATPSAAKPATKAPAIDKAARKKQQWTAMIIAFNFSVMGTMVLASISGHALHWGFIKTLFAAVIVGLVATAATYVVTELKR